MADTTKRGSYWNLARKIKLLKRFEKSTFYVILTLLLIFLTVQVIKCCLKFTEEPTYTTTQIVRQQEAEFPATTYCASKSGYKDNVLKVSPVMPCYIL